jgi:FkbM family methyltransferase
VVAVEANPVLVQRAKSSLRAYLESGQLQLVNAAVHSQDGNVQLTVCGDDLGSSSIFHDRVAERSPAGTFSISAMSAKRLFETYGVPFYLKIDIEGADKLCVYALTRETKPPYLSFEIDDELEQLLAHLGSIGFTQFKIINQCDFRELSKQNSIRDRAARKLMRCVGYSEPQYMKRAGRWFKRYHSSGPAPWCSDGCWTTQHETTMRWNQAKALNKLSGWYDLHAK